MTESGRRNERRVPDRPGCPTSPLASGRTDDDAHREAERYAEETGIPYLHAFSDPLVVAGQGTVGVAARAMAPGCRATRPQSCRFPRR